MNTTTKNIYFCKDWKGLTDILYAEPTHIAFDADMLTQNSTTVFEFMSMIETLIKFAIPGRFISIGICINKDTPHSLIKDLKKTSALGILPSSLDFGCNESANAIDEILKGHPYWPRNIIEQLPGAVIKTKNIKDEIRLTNRQTEIFELVCKRGLSNKKIAQILNISESTVKVHISAILKAYRVRNRTQLALSGTDQGLRA